MLKKIVISLCLACPLALPALAEGQPPALPQEEIIVHSQGNSHRFTVEMAVTPEVQQTGLMHRTQLRERHGMLFVWNADREVSMWMKNTLIPLDMFFIDSSGTIVHIERDTVPRSLKPLSPGRPVRAVMELAGGTAKAMRIDVGDRVEHNLFQP